MKKRDVEMEMGVTKDFAWSRWDTKAWRSIVVDTHKFTWNWGKFWHLKEKSNLFDVGKYLKI